MMTRKGISPLIAAVLLIAFTLAVAALLTAWVTTFTQDTTGAIGDRSTEVIECSYAGLSVYSVSYDSANDWVNISIANTGTTGLGNVTVVALENGVVVGDSPVRLGPNEDQEAPAQGGIVSVGITGLSAQPTAVRASSTACPGITDTETNIQ